jgi:hypothetical protein
LSIRTSLLGRELGEGLFMSLFDLLGRRRPQEIAITGERLLVRCLALIPVAASEESHDRLLACVPVRMWASSLTSIDESRSE